MPEVEFISTAEELFNALDSSMDSHKERTSAFTSSEDMYSNPSTPVRLPSTRKIFHAVRAPPLGLTAPLKLCQKPSALT
ncbi:MAG: hypothetical protein GQ550_08255 [Gammaproteobacteria bacterium]|nr:hypothetical protein [Gammaproteobacteria bacterium]